MNCVTLGKLSNFHFLLSAKTLNHHVRASHENYIIEHESYRIKAVFPLLQHKTHTAKPNRTQTLGPKINDHLLRACLLDLKVRTLSTKMRTTESNGRSGVRPS